MTTSYDKPPEEHRTRPLGRMGSRIVVILAVLIIVAGSFFFARYLINVAADPETQERMEQLEEREQDALEQQTPE